MSVSPMIDSVILLAMRVIFKTLCQASDHLFHALLFLLGAVDLEPTISIGREKRREMDSFFHQYGKTVLPSVISVFTNNYLLKWPDCHSVASSLLPHFFPPRTAQNSIE